MNAAYNQVKMNNLVNESIENTKRIQTNWEDLGISNDFLSGKVMQNPELCKELLQEILPDLKIYLSVSLIYMGKGVLFILSKISARKTRVYQWETRL